MKQPGTLFIAARLDYEQTLWNAPDLALQVGEILTRPCMRVLSGLSSRRYTRSAPPGRWTTRVPMSVERIAEYLMHFASDAVSAGTKTYVKPRAMVVIENGRGRKRNPLLTCRWTAQLVLPLAGVDRAAVIGAVCDLAAILRVGAGYIAVDNCYRGAQDTLVGMQSLRGRGWVSVQRRRERRTRLLYPERLATEIAGVEWGTFLGPGHLTRIDLAAVWRSSAFAQIVRLAPTLAYLQLTADPEDDLAPGIEAKLATAREALAPLLKVFSERSGACSLA